MSASLTTRAFGLALDARFELPGTWPAAPAGTGLPRVRLEVGPASRLEEVWDPEGSAPEWHTMFPDGSEVIAEGSPNGSYRFSYGDRGRYVLAPDRSTIHCAAADESEPRWLRFLLDTVLWWTSLAHGYHVLHASAVEGPGGVVLFASRTGGGKTTLALEFLRRGWRLFSDDVVAIEPTDERPVAHPGPPLMNAPADQPELETLGTAIAPIDDETWLSVRSAGSGPQRLAGVFLYSRGEDRRLEIDPTEASVLDLVPHVWDIRSDADRLRDRFALLADIVEHVPVYHLSAHSISPPARIADLVADCLSEGSTQR